MTDAFEPTPISDADQRLMISTELSVIRDLIARHAFTTAGLQDLNHRLVLPPGRITSADAQMTALRDAVITELHAALIEATGIHDLDYWQYPHRIEAPDDLAGMDDDTDPDTAA